MQCHTLLSTCWEGSHLPWKVPGVWGSGEGAQHGPSPAAAPPGALGLCWGVPKPLASCPGTGAGQDSAPSASPTSALPWALAFILGSSSRFPWPFPQRSTVTYCYARFSPYSLTIRQTDSARHKIQIMSFDSLLLNCFQTAKSSSCRCKDWNCREHTTATGLVFFFSSFFLSKYQSKVIKGSVKNYSYGNYFLFPTFTFILGHVFLSGNLVPAKG